MSSTEREIYKELHYARRWRVAEKAAQCVVCISVGVFLTGLVIAAIFVVFG